MKWPRLPRKNDGATRDFDRGLWLNGRPDELPDPTFWEGLEMWWESDAPAVVGQVALEVTHIGLDIAGLVPVWGIAADLLNAGIYLAEGRLPEAGFSAFAAIPGLGYLAAGGQVAKYSYKAARVADIGINLVESGYYGYQGYQNDSKLQMGMSAFGFGVNTVSIARSVGRMYNAKQGLLFRGLPEGTDAQRALRHHRVGFDQLAEIDESLLISYRRAGKDFGGILPSSKTPRRLEHLRGEAHFDPVEGIIYLPGDFNSQPLMRMLDEVSHAIDHVDPRWPAKHARLLKLGKKQEMSH